MVVVDSRAEVYSISEAAAVLRVSRVSIWRWIRNGQLPAARLGHRTARIRREDVERLLRRSGGDPVSAPLDGAHAAQFYESDAYLLDTLTDYVSEGVRAGDAVVVVASAAHCAAIAARVVAGPGPYILCDAAEILGRICVDGTPNPDRFRAEIDAILRTTAIKGRRVRIFGEMVSLLAEAGNHADAIQLEALWNDLRRTQTFALLCGYSMAGFTGADAEHLTRVCEHHSRVIPAESYTAIPPGSGRSRAVTSLQQKARSLEGEIARRRATEEQLSAALAAEREARAAAERALEQRDEFLSIASHELKTPLASLSAQAQLVQRRVERNGQVAPEELIGALRTITGRVGKLAQLVDQLLDVSRLEAGKLPLQCVPTNIGVLVEQVVDGARGWTDRHVVGCETEPALIADVDAMRLEQVLNNLLDNAIKYSPEPGSIDVRAQRAEAGRLRIVVRDRGLGIPPERRADIFDRFYQAHGNGYRSGMGLGLFISRQIVELHGGEILVEFPTDGEGGTRFVVHLPSA